jgi:hypothetical protein
LPPRATKITAAEVIRLAGTKAGRDAADAFVARGAGALHELFEALLHPAKVPLGDTHPADFEADFSDLLVRLARAHPTLFVSEITRSPELLEHASVLGAAGAVRSEATDRWVLTALAHKSQFHRWRALRILLDRSDPQIVPRLRKLLRDRSDMVRFVAADGLRRWGVVDDIEELMRYGARAGRGGAERAFDAIESICKRAGVPLPSAHPGERLIEIDVPAGCVDEVLEMARVVSANELLATVDGKELRAPCAGLVVALDREPDGRLVRFVLRKDR